MPDKRLRALANECRERAEEILARAETFHNAGAKQRMLELAAQYEKLAERLEQAAGKPLGALAGSGAAGLPCLCYRWRAWA